MKKKILSMLLVFALCLSLASCSSNNGGKSSEAIYKPGTYKASETGYNKNQPVEIAVTVSENKIEKIEIEKEEETDGIGKQALESLVKTILEKQSIEVDTMASATLSSTALLKAVDRALKEAATGKDMKSENKEASKDKKDTYDVDVAIIGSGGAGLSAALEAHSKNMSVLILEKAGLTGGNTTRSTGGMNAAKTKYQDKNKFSEVEVESINKKIAKAREKYPALNKLADKVESQLKEYLANPNGYFDSKELFMLDTFVGGGNLNNPEIVETFVEKTPDTIEWLNTLGMEFTDVASFGGASVKRIHRPSENGKSVAVGAYLVPRLTKLVNDAKIEILFNTTATELIVKDDAVVGVKANDITVNAKSVIIATGGFGANLEKVAKLKPELKGYVTTNAATITGDGILMAEKIGADLVDMDQIQIHPTVEQKSASLITEGVRGDGAILVNQDGKRFVNEVSTRDVVSAAEVAQKGSYAYLIFDKKMADKSGPIQKYIKNGFTESGDDLKDLAKKLNIDELVFKETMDTWNKAVEDKKDPEFNRGAFAEKLDQGPFYAIKVSPGVHYTMGGLKTNSKAEVLNKDGKPIKNLYAAGEVTGGLHGSNRLGGNAVSEILVFGRIAGENASNNAK